MKNFPQFEILSTTNNSPSVNSSGQPNGDYVGRISVTQSGIVRFNGERVDIEQLRGKLLALKLLNGVVWYYRESFGQESPAISAQVIQLVIEAKLNVSFSTSPDFSTVVLSNGTVRQRHGF